MKGLTSISASSSGTDSQLIVRVFTNKHRFESQFNNSNIDGEWHDPQMKSTSGAEYDNCTAQSSDSVLRINYPHSKDVPLSGESKQEWERWLHNALQEASELVGEAAENEISPPSTETIDTVVGLLWRMASIGDLPPVSVFPEEDKSVSIQMGHKKYGGTILITCHYDKSVTIYIVGEAPARKLQFPRVSVLTDIRLKSIISQALHAAGGSSW